MFSWEMAILQSIEYYIPVACTVLFIIFLLPSKSSKSNYFMIAITFSVFALVGLFSIKEILLPMTRNITTQSSLPIQAPFASVLTEFNSNNSLPKKYGIILNNDNMCAVFGSTTRQNSSSFLVQNIFLKSNNGMSIFANYGKIVNKQIILYQANTTPNNPQNPPQNYILPLPFEMDAFFQLWNTHDYKQIELIPIIANNIFPKAMIKPIILSIAFYVISLLSLLVISIISTSLSNTIYFSFNGILGTIAVVVCSFPFALLINEYIKLFIGALINYIY